MTRLRTRLIAALGAMAIAAGSLPSRAQAPEINLTQQGRLISLRFKDASLHEVFDVLSRHEKVNILLGKGVSGNVSLSLYNVDPRQAIHTVASVAGYVVEKRGADYFVVERKDSRLANTGNTQVRSFKVQYSNTRLVADILTKHLSPSGKITALEERSTLVIEDQPDFLARLERILQEVDSEPKQILIEAKILEITLDQSEVFGVDWQKVFSADRTNAVGTSGLAPRGVAGLFFNLVNRNLEVYLAALSSKGRVQTLSTPKLLALENQEASAVIGDRIGYRVTTTINQVTTESIQFLETGVILRVTPSVDQQGRVRMRIHPEVSSASVAGGIPSKKSTEVTTQLLCDDGESIFIGGLIKQSTSARRSGVPVLSDIWGIGRAFSSNDESTTMTETVVIITPRIVRQSQPSTADLRLDRIEAVRSEVERKVDEVERKLAPAVPVPVPGAAGACTNDASDRRRAGGCGRAADGRCGRAGTRRHHARACSRDPGGRADGRGGACSSACFSTGPCNGGDTVHCRCAGLRPEPRPANHLVPKLLPAGRDAQPAAHAPGRFRRRALKAPRRVRRRQRRCPSTPALLRLRLDFAANRLRRGLAADAFREDQRHPARAAAADPHRLAFGLAVERGFDPVAAARHAHQHVGAVGARLECRLARAVDHPHLRIRRVLVAVARSLQQLDRQGIARARLLEGARLAEVDAAGHIGDVAGALLGRQHARTFARPVRRRTPGRSARCRRGA